VLPHPRSLDSYGELAHLYDLRALYGEGTCSDQVLLLDKVNLTPSLSYLKITFNLLDRL